MRCAGTCQEEGTDLMVKRSSQATTAPLGQPMSLHSKKVVILTQKPHPEQDRGGSNLQPPGLTCPTRRHKENGHLALGDTKHREANSYPSQKHINRMKHLCKNYATFLGDSYSTATLGCTAVLQQWRGIVKQQRNSRGDLTLMIPSKHISWQQQPPVSAIVMAKGPRVGGLSLSEEPRQFRGTIPIKKHIP